jgi:NitT/TauT family transport system ATP-binding protein
MIAPLTIERSPIVTIKNLSLRFPVANRPVFDEINLSVQRGEFVALVGGSGVGKSTMLRVIANLIPPSSGHVIFRSDPRPGRRRRSFVFQDSRLLPWRTLAGNIAFGLEGLSLSKAERAQRIVEVLDLTLLTEFAARWPYQLSGGQQQRGGIARALAVKPDLLLMDEPFSSVDAITRQVLQDELLRIWQASGSAILFVTHDISEAVLLADRILVMKGSPARLIRDVHVHLARPRQRNGADTFKIISDIAASL